MEAVLAVELRSLEGAAIPTHERASAQRLTTQRLAEHESVVVSEAGLWLRQRKRPRYGVGHGVQPRLRGPP